MTQEHAAVAQLGHEPRWYKFDLMDLFVFKLICSSMVFLRISARSPDLTSQGIDKHVGRTFTLLSRF